MEEGAVCASGVAIRGDALVAGASASTPLGARPMCSYGRPDRQAHSVARLLSRGAATLAGTDHAETLLGTPAPDVIAGLGGNDIIRGLRRR